MRSALVVAALAIVIPDGAIRVDPGRKQLFLDDYVLERVTNLQRTMHQPQKRGPVVKADRPSDGQSIATFSAPLWVPSEGVYKVVYECRYSDEKTPNQYAWALSKDGIKWTKPNFGLVEFAGSKDNNLFPTPDGLRLFHVVYDPDDPDPQRRYKGFLGASGRRPAVSADGLNWKKLDIPVLPSGDAGTLTYDRQKKMFLGLLKAAGPLRKYNLSTSTDFNTWTEPRPIFAPDEQDQKMAPDVIRRRLADPALAKPMMVDPDPAIGWQPPPGRTLTPTWRTECYNIGIFPYEGVYMALLMMYYPTGQRLPQWRNADGFHLIQLAMTRDLKQWVRLGNREPFIGPSPLTEGLVGNYDRLQLAPPNEAVVRGDELWFYYVGYKVRVDRHDRYTDGRPRDPSTLSAAERADLIDDGHSAIHLAVLRRDGFVSLDGGTSGGELLTKPLSLTGKRLFLNLDASTAGRAMVELVGDDGKPVPGFTATVSGNAVRLPVRFKSGATLETLAGRTVRMKLGLRDARLYAFWTE